MSTNAIIECFCCCRVLNQLLVVDLVEIGVLNTSRTHRQTLNETIRRLADAVNHRLVVRAADNGLSQFLMTSLFHCYSDVINGICQTGVVMATSRPIDLEAAALSLSTGSRGRRVLTLSVGVIFVVYFHL